MEQFTLDADTLSSLTSAVTDPAASGNLGFLAGVLLVLMVIIAAFAVTTFVLGIVACVKAARAGRTCGWQSAMAKASVAFGILGIVAPIVMWRLSDTMCATGLLIAGFVCSIVAISSASARMRAHGKASVVVREPAVEAEREPEPAAEVEAESELDVVEPEVVVESEPEAVEDDADAADDGDDGLSEQVTMPLRVISADESGVRPVDPTEPAIEEKSDSSVDDSQADVADAPEHDPVLSTTEDDGAETATDDVAEAAEGDTDDAKDTDEEDDVEPMHKMTAAEREADHAARRAEEKARAEARARQQARARALAAEDPEYAEYLASTGRVAGSLRKG